MAPRLSKRNQIVQTAETLFFTRGIHGVSMEEVAETASVSKATLYKYFENKERLLEGVLEVHTRKTLETFDSIMKQKKSVPEKFRAMIEANEKLDAEISRLFRVQALKDYNLAVQSMMKNADTHITPLVRNLFEQGQKEKSVHPYVDIEAFLFLHRALHKGFLDPELIQPEKITDCFMDDILKIIWGGIFVHAPI